MVMSRICVILAASLFASTVLTVPISLRDDPGARGGAGEQIPNDNGFLNDLSAASADVNTKTITSVGPRTLIMFGLLRWLTSVVKAMVKPARDMYITMMPEISAFRCLSDSREFQNIVGFSGSDVEGYVYETPRTSGRRLPTDDGSSYDRHYPSDQGFSNEVYAPELSQNIHSDARYSPENYSYYEPPEKNAASQTIQHRTDEVLKRIPRFIDEFASLLKEGQAMNCIMPYMRERVTRWLDN